jgi:sodium/potassium-transporting ATPase subunit alpha
MNVFIRSIGALPYEWFSGLPEFEDYVMDKDWHEYQKEFAKSTSWTISDLIKSINEYTEISLSQGKDGLIVLLDDNFATIVKAIKAGRTVYDNIKNFITYILTSNTPEIVPFLMFILLGWPLALPALLILAIDLGTDVLPAISLGMERSEKDVMKHKPRKPTAKLLTGKMILRSYGIIGPLETLIAYIFFFYVLIKGGWSFGHTISVTSGVYMQAISAFFVSIVISQVFNVFACRTSRTSTFRKALLENKFMWLGIFAELLLTILIINLPLFQNAFGTRMFNLNLIPFMFLLSSLILFIEELRKLLYRKYGLFGLSEIE